MGRGNLLAAGDAEIAGFTRAVGEVAAFNINPKLKANQRRAYRAQHPVLDVYLISTVYISHATFPEEADGRIELVLDWAKARKYRDGENPARWRGHLDKNEWEPNYTNSRDTRKYWDELDAQMRSTLDDLGLLKKGN